MPADMDQLLAGASGEPGAPPDPDDVWAAGRRRRRWLQAGGVATAAASVAVLGVVAIGVSSSPTPTVDPVAEGPERSESTTPMGEVGDTTHPGDELPRMESPPPPPPPEDEPEVEEPAEPEPTGEPTEEPTEASPPPAPEPEAGATEDPCAAHQGREGDAFIDLTAPVQGQSVGGQVELVGCSNVPEANVRFRLLDASGQVLVDHFTTATCGTGCVGEFRETTTVDATGEVTVQVFWESPKDGAEEDLSEVVVDAG